MHELDYVTADDEMSLSKGLEFLYAQNSKPVILEIFTPTLENNTILLQYFKELI